jgi:hypothetical protein
MERGVPGLKHDPQPADMAEDYATIRSVYNDPAHLTIEFLR